jgi:hypothetical protein
VCAGRGCCMNDVIYLHTHRQQLPAVHVGAHCTAVKADAKDALQHKVWTGLVAAEVLLQLPPAQHWTWTVAGSMTAYRVGGNGSSACSDCSYFAPTMRFAVRPGVLTYHTFITLGTVEDIRCVSVCRYGLCFSWNNLLRMACMEAAAAAPTSASERCCICTVLQLHVTSTCAIAPRPCRKEFSGIRGWAAANRPQLLQCDAMTGATLAI